MRATPAPLLAWPAIAALAACSAAPAYEPRQAPAPELAVQQLRETYVEAMECRMTGELKNTGTAPLDEGMLHLVYYDGPTERRIAGQPLPLLPVGETRPLAISYPCDEAIGLRRLRAFAGARRVAVVES